MPYAGIVEPEQLAILTAIVEAYCKENGIDPTGDEREEVARLVMKLYCRGIATAEELRTVLLGPMHSAGSAIDRPCLAGLEGCWESAKTSTRRKSRNPPP
jgi:hypothetical protein